MPQLLRLGARITQSNLWIFRDAQTLLDAQSLYLLSHSAPSHRPVRGRLLPPSHLGLLDFLNVAEFHVILTFVK